MREQIFAAVIGSDEAKALRIVEPLDSTRCHKNSSLIKTNKPATDRRECDRSKPTGHVCPTSFYQQRKPNGNPEN
jgi:hypothetical protein